MKVMVAMSGGVDSSIAAAELVAAGHEVVGVTMRLWGGSSDTGCCSIADVDDARRVAQQLDIDHVVFNFTDDFDRHVVDPYVDAHRHGRAPNPCIECNRHLKFDRLLERAEVLGFDRVATGHHARVVADDGVYRVARGADPSKDQSYVVHMLGQQALARIDFPIGHLTKSEVRERAAAHGLRTAAKPDSQDVCFIGREEGRSRFLGARIPLRPAAVVDTTGRRLGEVPSVELVTLGQRRGLGLRGGTPPTYAVAIDHAASVVTVGDEQALLRSAVDVEQVVWSSSAVRGPVRVQCSAHGATAQAELVVADDASATVSVRWHERQRAVAPGQSVVFYDVEDRVVLGGGIAR